MKREYIIYEVCNNRITNERIYHAVHRATVGTARAAFNRAVRALGLERAEIGSRIGANWYSANGYNPTYQQYVRYEIIG